MKESAEEGKGEPVREGREEGERLDYRRHLITSYNYSRLEGLTAV